MCRPLSPLIQNGLKSLGYALLVVGLAQLLPFLLEYPFVELYQVKDFAGHGVELNDLHYRFDRGEKRRIQDVVLMNTEGLGDGSPSGFRADLASLLKELTELQPEVVGVDLLFAHIAAPDEAMQQATQALQGQLRAHPNIVVGALPDEPSRLVPDSARWGMVNLPDSGRVPIRSYCTSLPGKRQAWPSFALRLAEGYRPGIVEQNDVPCCFPIHYPRADAFISPIGPSRGRPLTQQRTEGFPLLQGVDFLAHPSAYREWIQGKVVIIGKVSLNPFDIEDKHRVPFDPILVNRLPTISGPIIHAAALENMLHFEELGWRYVPEGIRSASAFLLLVALIYLVLYTKSGKTMNFTILGAISLPLLLMGFVLMNWGWYWPMTSTLLGFIFIEEIMEVVQPAVHRWLRAVVAIAQRFTKKRSVKAAALLPALLALSAATAQNFDVLVIRGTFRTETTAHTRDANAFFTVYRGDEFVAEEGSIALVSDVSQGTSAIWDAEGSMDFEAIEALFEDDAPPLSAEFLRVVFVEGMQTGLEQVNIGAAIRSAATPTLLPTDGAVIWADSVWVGYLRDDAFPPPLSWELVRDDGLEWRSGTTSAGGEWIPVDPGQSYAFRLQSYDVVLSKGKFRVAGADELVFWRSWHDSAGRSCRDCGPALLDSIRSRVHPTPGR